MSTKTMILAIALCASILLSGKGVAAEMIQTVAQQGLYFIEDTTGIHSLSY